MVKHTLSTNFVSVFDHFVGLALEGLILSRDIQDTPGPSLQSHIITLKFRVCLKGVSTNR